MLYLCGYNGVEIQNHIWISENGEPVMGYGRYVLLEKIIETGSLSKAAKMMNISYKKAWKLIDSMNTNSSQLVLETSRGGKQGGGTKVTEFGLSLMKKFLDAQEKNKEMIASMNQQLFEND